MIIMIPYMETLSFHDQGFWTYLLPSMYFGLTVLSVRGRWGTDTHICMYTCIRMCMYICIY